MGIKLLNISIEERTEMIDSCMLRDWKLKLH